MKRHHLGVGIALLILGAVSVQAAPGKHVAGSSGRSHRAKSIRSAMRPAAAKSRTSARLVTRTARTSVRPALPVRAKAGGRRILLAQAAPGERPAQTTSPQGQIPDAGRSYGPISISREAEPLMLRALAAYYVTDESMLRDLRGKGWSFGDLATAGNLGARSHRSLYEVARSYERRRDWTAVARDYNVPAEDLYVVANAPRYAMMRLTVDEETRMVAAAAPPPGEVATGVAPPAATATAAPAAATARPAAATAANAAVAPNAVAPANAAVPETAPPAATGIVQAPPRTMMTVVERVAAARLELLPREPDTLLRYAVASYYAVPPSTLRDLEAQGWSINDVLVAGNLAHRSEATIEEIAALHGEGSDWNTVADRIGVGTDQLYQPTMTRRVYAVPDRATDEDRERMERIRRARERREWEWAHATHHGNTLNEEQLRHDPHDWAGLLEEQRREDEKLLREEQQMKHEERDRDRGYTRSRDRDRERESSTSHEEHHEKR